MRRGKKWNWGIVTERGKIASSLKMESFPCWAVHFKTLLYAVTSLCLLSVVRLCSVRTRLPRCVLILLIVFTNSVISCSQGSLDVNMTLIHLNYWFALAAPPLCFIWTRTQSQNPATMCLSMLFLWSLSLLCSVLPIERLARQLRGMWLVELCWGRGQLCVEADVKACFSLSLPLSTIFFTLFVFFISPPVLFSLLTLLVSSCLHVQDSTPQTALLVC